MALLQSRYEIRAGQPARIAAPAETLDFLLHAKTRRVSIEGMETSGLVVGPGYTPRSNPPGAIAAGQTRRVHRHALRHQRNG